MRSLSKRVPHPATTNGHRAALATPPPPLRGWQPSPPAIAEPELSRCTMLLPEITATGVAGLWEWMELAQVADVTVKPGVTRIRTIDGTWTDQAPLAETADDVIALIRQAVADAGYLEDPDDGEYDVSVVQGRLWATLDWGPEPTMVLRSHAGAPKSLEELIQGGLCTPALGVWLRQAIDVGLNIVIGGHTGAGKTTLCGALLRLTDQAEQIATIEDVLEINLHRERASCFAYLARPANSEGKGGRSMRRLLHGALRSSPDRVVVGEVRGREAVVMLRAMSTGVEGSLSTVHGRTGSDCLRKLNSYLLEAGEGRTPESAANEIAEAVDLVIQVRRSRDRRYISEVIEVTGAEGDHVEWTPLWSAPPGELAERTDLPMMSELAERFGPEP